MPQLPVDSFFVFVNVVKHGFICLICFFYNLYMANERATNTVIFMQLYYLQDIAILNKLFTYKTGWNIPWNWWPSVLQWGSDVNEGCSNCKLKHVCVALESKVMNDKIFEPGFSTQSFNSCVSWSWILTA